VKPSLPRTPIRGGNLAFVIPAKAGIQYLNRQLHFFPFFPPSKTLGSLTYEKGRIKIVAVFEKMAIGDLLPGGMNFAISSILSNIKNNQAMIKSEDWKIRVGDIAKEV